MKKTFTLYHEILDTPNAIPSPESFFCENRQLNVFGNQDGPSKRALHNVLSYAKALNIIKTKEAGNVYLLSN